MNIYRRIKRRWLIWKFGDTLKQLWAEMGDEYINPSKYSEMEQSNPEMYVLRRRVMGSLANLIEYDKVYNPERVEAGKEMLSLVLKMGSKGYVE